MMVSSLSFSLPTWIHYVLLLLHLLLHLLPSSTRPTSFTSRLHNSSTSRLGPYNAAMRIPNTHFFPHTLAHSI
ncbi:hypothetical protein E2C01_087092 [Portunus trituberculatus]|uniref:Secreted protein n=1 Tax=Portunus trituberculatus TaxID=210409 RepID=A0A5B7JCE8_PORTR|nr:hypothetical protein [Portunus trituberculatus]